jgi:molybdopterin synthase sulfur carrier subunit
MDVHYFARYREALGLSSESVEWEEGLNTLDDLRLRLASRGGAWSVLNEPNLMCAVNQELCGLDATLQPDDEVAFFPTVTGG